MTTSDLTPNDWKTLEWILQGTFDTKVRKESIFRGKEKAKDESEAKEESKAKEGKRKSLLVEIGPRLNFSSAFSTNAVSICEASGIVKKVRRIERSTLYFISLQVSYGCPYEGILVQLVLTDLRMNEVRRQKVRERVTEERKRERKSYRKRRQSEKGSD